MSEAPTLPPEKAQWLYKHGGEITALRVDYVMLTEDTSKTVWHVTLSDNHKATVDQQDVAGLLDFYPSSNVPRWRAIAALRPEFKAQCEARQKWEKSNARELAAYERLRKKFG